MKARYIDPKQGNPKTIRVDVECGPVMVMTVPIGSTIDDISDFDLVSFVDGLLHVCARMGTDSTIAGHSPGGKFQIDINTTGKAKGDAMTRQPLSSHLLASAGYDPETQILEVEFARGGIYEYEGVEPETYQAFLDATSHGSYLLSEIKGRYPYRKVN